MQALNPKSDQKFIKSKQLYMLPPSGKFSVGVLISAVLGAKIYYPSLEKNKPYILSGMVQKKLKPDTQELPGISKEDHAKLDEIQTYISENLNIAHGTFPTIIFSPGTDTPAEYYENIISDLVSQGFIIIARDNIKKDHKAAYEEVASIRQKLKKLYDSDAIFSAMNLHQIGLMGHSLGGAVSILAAHKSPKDYQGVIALDAPTYLPITTATSDDPFYWDVRKEIKIPALQMHASTWQRRYSGENPAPLQLAERNYHVVLSPDTSEIDYSDHNNFSDTSTLQYHPISKIFERSLLDIETQAPGTLASHGIDPKNPFCIGRKADGYAIAIIINQYIQHFFNTFLKKQPHPTFSAGMPIAGTLMRCKLAKDKSLSHSTAALFAEKSIHHTKLPRVATPIDKNLTASDAPKDVVENNDAAPSNALQ